MQVKINNAHCLVMLPIPGPIKSAFLANARDYKAFKQ